MESGEVEADRLEAQPYNSAGGEKKPSDDIEQDSMNSNHPIFQSVPSLDEMQI